jgi:hypothetical protein
MGELPGVGDAQGVREPRCGGGSQTGKDRFCGKVDQLQLDDRVRFRGGEFVVRGLSPRTVVPGRVIIEDLATGEQVEVAIHEIDDPATGPVFSVHSL